MMSRCVVKKNQVMQQRDAKTPKGVCHIYVKRVLHSTPSKQIVCK